MFLVLALQFGRLVISRWGIHFCFREYHERIFHLRLDEDFYRLTVSNLGYFPIVVSLNLEKCENLQGLLFCFFK